jgi:hypothetical protein
VRERDIERRLVERVKDLWGEVRKVKWVGRDGAPDRLVMLPEITGGAWAGERTKDGMRYVYPPKIVRPGRTIWIELKRPGGAATFPANAHERKQQREHERMRRMGQRVEVVDSFERIEEILA